MAGLLSWLAAGAALTTVLAGLVWLGRWARRRAGRAGLLSPAEEIFHPAAHRYRFVIEADQQRQEPSPSPHDRPHRDRHGTDAPGVEPGR